MMKKIKAFGIIFISCILVILLGCIVILKSEKKQGKTNINMCNEEWYSFKYDESWKIKEKSESTIKLSHKKKGKIEINIVPLSERYTYQTTEEFIDEFQDDIIAQNKGYNLLSKEHDVVTKNGYDGYKLLYEDKNSQVLVTVAKKTDRAIIVTYQATNETFDILLDSVQSIIYDFNLKDVSEGHTIKVNVETVDINWRKNKNINKIKSLATWNIANNNYYMEYEIPKRFKSISMDSRAANFRFSDLEDGQINLSVSIYNMNIYEMFDENKALSLASRYETLSKNSDYKNLKKEIQEYDKNGEGYIQRVSYKVKSLEYDKEKGEIADKLIDCEEISIVWELDKEHVGVFKLDGRKAAITEELIESIRVKKTKNYHSYVTSKIEGDKLVGQLKSYTNYDYDKTRNMILSLPSTYEECDTSNDVLDDNVYAYKKYGKMYNEDMNDYGIRAEYDISISENIALESLNKEIESNKKYGLSNAMTYKGEKVYNNNTFKVYMGSYNTTYGTLSEKADNETYLVDVVYLYYKFRREVDTKSVSTIDGMGITIKCRDIELTKSTINDLTNIKENIEEVEGKYK